MFEWNPTDIRKIIKTCGDLALRYYEAPRTEIKSDRSLVTEADHAIETHLESVFDHPESGSYLIGEETIAHRSAAYVEDAFQNEAWIVDPIDGTAPYANHLPTWGVSIGRMVDGSLTDGAICLPVTNEIFFTDGPTVRYGTLTGECRPIDPRAPRLGADDEKKTGMIALTQALAKGRGIAVPNPVQALGCTILPLTYLLLGRYVAYIGTVKLWDIAGALPMLHRAGFETVLTDGTVVGSSVDDTVYRLDPDDEGQWKLRHRMVCAKTRDLVDYVRNAVR